MLLAVNAVTKLFILLTQGVKIKITIMDWMDANNRASLYQDIALVFASSDCLQTTLHRIISMGKYCFLF